MRLSDIHPYEQNAKVHTPKQVTQIAKSIKEFGFNQPIVVDKNNEIIVGHGRYWAAQELGLQDVPVIVLDKLTPEQVQAYRLADNKLNESDWEMHTVIEELKYLDSQGFDIELTGFDKDLILEPEAEDDVIPENVPAVSKLGDLYVLGNHRVLCGDSTKIEDVEKLMDGKKADVVVTDPPYNTGMDGEGKPEKAGLSHMFKDKIENWGVFLKDVFTNYILNTKGECAFYVFIDWRRVADIKSTLEGVMDVKNIIVWDKGVHGLGSDYKFTYELIVVGKKGNPDIHNRFGLDYQDVWRLQREIGRNDKHATAKPIELCEKPIKHASKEDDIVMDLFLGSGSTLIAAEKTNRICYGMELDPKYIDVIVQRWVDYTGIEEVKKNGKIETWKKTPSKTGISA